jgi:hypothetical protein
MPIKSGPYLDYLDKEMTIMGVLSAFSVTVAGLSVTQTAGAEETSRMRPIWESNPELILVGAAASLVSGLLFYRQRSLLAWYYGQLVLSEIREDEGQPLKMLSEADGWTTWIQYRVAFAVLYFAVACIIVASVRSTGRGDWIGVSNGTILALSGACLFIYCAAVWIAFRKFSQHDHPWRQLWSCVTRLT